jgi:hypothetical protein
LQQLFIRSLGRNESKRWKSSDETAAVTFEVWHQVSPVCAFVFRDSHADGIQAAEHDEALLAARIDGAMRRGQAIPQVRPAS